MLILSRQEGESIVVGEDVVITVIEIRSGGRVRLGIDAPRGVRVDRSEIRLQKDEQREGGAA